MGWLQTGSEKWSVIETFILRIASIQNLHPEERFLARLEGRSFVVRPSRRRFAAPQDEGKALWNVKALNLPTWGEMSPLWRQRGKLLAFQ